MSGCYDNHCIASGCETRTTIKNILEIMPGAEESLKIGNILCLCTYVTDVCVMLLSRNEGLTCVKLLMY